METFNITVYAYLIGSTDWNLHKAFYFKASNLEIEKRDKYFIAKVIAHELPLEHYKKKITEFMVVEKLKLLFLNMLILMGMFIYFL